MSYFGIPVRNGLPIGLGTVAPLGTNNSPFSPASFFANGEQGWWYDPSNFATLFQDSAGTTPVTAVEQPVGLQLDLSKGLLASTKGGQMVGVSGSGFDTPSATANQITGDIDIRVQASLVSWTPAAITVFCSRVITGGNTADSYEFWISTSGVLQLLTVSGTTNTNVASSAAVGFAAGTTNWVRVTWQQSTGFVNFYTSSDGVTWTQNGTANRAGTTSATNAGSRTLRLGARVEGSFPLNGTIYRTQIYNGINGTLAVDFNPTLYTSGATYTAATGEVWTITGTNARIVPNGNHRFQSTSANRPVVSARVNLFVGTATLATQSVTTRATAHTLTFTGAGSITLTGTAIGIYTAGTYSVTTTAGTLTATVLGTVTQADLRETNVGVGLPAYQAVVTSTNYDSTGFPVYIEPNGSNQFMQTNSINFTATDKMTVWQGVRKLSDAARAILIELSTSYGNAGTFGFDSPLSSVTNDYRFVSGGSVGGGGAAQGNGFVAPITNVITGIGDISGDLATLRVNSAQVAQGTGNQGTGNYSNSPAYFYARAGTSLFFNGNDYGSIARGAASTAAQITNGETYINSKTKAYT